MVAAVWAHDRPGEPAPDLEQTRSRLLEPPTTSRNLMWAALDEGRMCAVACLRLPHDPDRSGEIDIQVLPGYRRRGIGTRLLATAADGLRAAGCRR